MTLLKVPNFLAEKTTYMFGNVEPRRPNVAIKTTPIAKIDEIYASNLLHERIEKLRHTFIIHDVLAQMSSITMKH